jgi:hypothetical protein
MSLIRQKSSGEEGGSCWCGTTVTSSEPGHIRLGCRCLVCYQCVVGAIKRYVKDINVIQEWGIPCPYQNECKYKKQFGRTFYIADEDLAFLKEHGQANCVTLMEEIPTEEHEMYFITQSEIDLAKRLSKEKCIRLSCGCHVHYQDLIKHIRNKLCDVFSIDGIECPYRALPGVCRGSVGMFLNHCEISAVKIAGANFQKKGLMPPLSPRSDPMHLTDADIEAFDFKFHHHMKLHCGCFIHHNTATKHLSSILTVVKAKTTVARSELTIKDTKTNSLFHCPHGELCLEVLTRGTRPNLTVEDIDTIVQFGVTVGMPMAGAELAEAVSHSLPRAVSAQ